MNGLVWKAAVYDTVLTMFTFCPSCQRQFRIFAEQIAAASGEVRCGFCDHQFNVLNQLHDEPLTPAELELAINKLALQSEQPEEEPQFVIPSEKPKIKEEQETVITANHDSAEQELRRSINEIGVDESIESPNNIDLIDEEQNPEPIKPENKLVETKFTFNPVEEELELVEEKPRSRLTFFWSVSALLAIVILLTQLAWFQRDWLLQAYPQVRPYAKQLCDKLECSLFRQEDTSEITLLNRDVRLHPTYADTLLVNATMKNDLPNPQPYPKVQLTLFDTNGELIAFREFVPDEYLDNSIDVEQGMPVNSPVHFVLEVTGSSREAVSFEFRFL
ncbi:MAG: zinc-ribbon and DUF3426 domain-containing protein [Pseudomonadota bacterium]